MAVSRDLMSQLHNDDTKLGIKKQKKVIINKMFVILTFIINCNMTEKGCGIVLSILSLQNSNNR